MGCLGISSIIQNHRAGQLKIIAETSAKRSPELPDIPSIGETVPGYDATLWTGVLAPRGTPAAAINRVHRDLTQLMQSKEVRDAFERAGTTVEATNPKTFAELRKVEYEKWGGDGDETSVRKPLHGLGIFQNLDHVFEQLGGHE